MKFKKQSPGQDGCSLGSQAYITGEAVGHCWRAPESGSVASTAGILLGISSWAQSSVSKSQSTRVGRTIFNAIALSWSVM